MLFQNKMPCQEDFLVDEDFVLDAIDEDIWDKDDGFNAEIDSMIHRRMD